MLCWKFIDFFYVVMWGWSLSWGEIPGLFLRTSSHLACVLVICTKVGRWKRWMGEMDGRRWMGEMDDGADRRWCEMGY